MKQLVSFRGLDDWAHARIGQQIGELAVHHLKRHLHPSSTEPVCLRAGVERNTRCSGDAYRVKPRLVLSTITRATEEEGEHVADFSAFADIPAYPLKRARCTVTLVRTPYEVDEASSRFFNSGNRTKRSSSKTRRPAATNNPKRQRASMKCGCSRASCWARAQRVAARGAASGSGRCAAAGSRGTSRRGPSHRAALA